jgi:cyclopropane fatty-acyl-phospholipid synthase-like methyltransferase
MNKKTKASIASSLDGDLEILPYLPDLLIDLWSLGSALDVIVKMVQSLNLSSSAHLLDLGCGKGATAITIASRLDVQVTSIDANPEFLIIAGQKAVEHQVSEKCQFILDDIFNYVKQRREFDLVIFASLGGLFGNFKKTIGQLRRLVRTGGYIIIDDGYLKGKERVNRPGYKHYFSHEKCIAQLLSYGDTLLQEVSTVNESRQINQEYLEIITKRGQQLVQERPDLEPLVRRYIDTQKIECDLIEKFIHGATWMLKKSP